MSGQATLHAKQLKNPEVGLILVSSAHLSVSWNGQHECSVSHGLLMWVQQILKYAACHPDLECSKV